MASSTAALLRARLNALEAHTAGLLEGETLKARTETVDSIVHRTYGTVFTALDAGT